MTIQSHTLLPWTSFPEILKEGSPNSDRLFKLLQSATQRRRQDWDPTLLVAGSPTQLDTVCEYFAAISSGDADRLSKIRKGWKKFKMLNPGTFLTRNSLHLDQAEIV